MNALKPHISLPSIALVLATIAILPSAQGQLVYSNGFETNQGYFINGGTGGFGSIVGQGSPTWSTTLNNGTSLIVTNSKGTNSTTMTPPQGSQMLQTQYGTGSLTVQQNFLTTNNAIKESFNFSFQLAVQEDIVSNAGIYVGLKSSQDTVNGMDFGLLKYTDNGQAVYGFAARQSNPGGSSYATRIGTNTVSLNEFYTFDLTLDWETLTYNGLVYDSNNNLVTSFTNVAIWDRDGKMHDYGFNRVGLYVHQVGTRPYVLLDDMSVTLIGDYYWAPGAGGGGTGTWSISDANWAAAAGTAGTGTQSEYGTLIFGGAAGTVTVDGTAHVAKGLRFATNGYTITGDDVSLDGGGIGYNTIRTDTGVTATINSKLTGTDGFTKAGSGTLVLGGANDYTGGTAVFEGELAGTTTSLQGDIDNNAALAFSQTTNGTYTGAISGAGTLNKSGSGTVTFSGSSANTQTGKATVSAGTLELAKTAGTTAIAGNLEIKAGAKLLIYTSNQVADTSAVTLSGGTIERASGVSETFGNLNLTAASYLDYGTGGTGNLSFGTYTPSALLTVSNFLEGNTLVFKTDLSSSVTNGGYFSFDNGFTYNWNSGTFTITAIPEPSALVAVAGLVGLMFWSLRRRTKSVKSV